MVNHFRAISLMLIASIPSIVLATSINISHAHLHTNRLQYGRNRQDSAASSDVNCSSQACNDTIFLGQTCDSVNGSEITSQNGVWTFICDTDFKAQDIYPFILAGTFENCMKYCQEYSSDHSGACAGFVWAPSRSHLDNDCYLKSSVNDIIHPATLHLLGGILRTSSPTTLYPIRRRQKVSSHHPTSQPLPLLRQMWERYFPPQSRNL